MLVIIGKDTVIRFNLNEIIQCLQNISDFAEKCPFRGL